MLTKVFFEEIGDEGFPIETAFSIEEEGDRLQIESFTGLIAKAENCFLLQGSLRAHYPTLCGRCAESVVTMLNTEIRIAVKRGTPPDTPDEYENADEDGEVYYTLEEHIDLADLLRQEALLALPYSITCEKCSSSFIDIEDETGGEKTTPFKGLEKLKAAKPIGS